jgi:hypothetical protein
MSWATPNLLQNLAQTKEKRVGQQQDQKAGSITA